MDIKIILNENVFFGFLVALIIYLLIAEYLKNKNQ